MDLPNARAKSNFYIIVEFIFNENCKQGKSEEFYGIGNKMI